jgi:hypothetical protein
MLYPITAKTDNIIANFTNLPNISQIAIRHRMVSAEMIANPHTFSEMKVVSVSIQIYSIEIIKMQFFKVSTRKTRAIDFLAKI